MAHRMRRQSVNHTEIARELRDQPQVWGTVGIYPATYVAASTGYGIKTARRTFRMYGPAGSFETRTRPVDDGTLLEARYTAGAPAPQPTADETWAAAVSSLGTTAPADSGGEQ